MALIGKWIHITQKESETETRIVTISHPDNLKEDNPVFEKAGTTEDIEVPKQIREETIYKNAYAVIHSINSWKCLVDEEIKPMANINYRVYESKDSRLNDYESFIYQEHLTSQILDYTTNKTEMQQCYDLLKNTQGFEELIND